MELKNSLLKRKSWLFALILLQCVNSFIQGQSWSIEYVLDGDSLVYNLSKDKIIQGKAVDFFFPAYKYYQTSMMTAIESASIENREVIELELDTNFERVNFEIDIYAEEIDTIQYFLKTTDDSLILLSQNKTHQGYKYQPTA